MTDLLVQLSIWKIVVLGLFAVAALGTLIPILGVIFGTRMVREPAPNLPSAVRILGNGVVCLAVGAGLVVARYGFAEIDTWGTIGILVLSVGCGLAFYAIVVAISERRRRRDSERKAAEPAEGTSPLP